MSELGPVKSSSFSILAILVGLVGLSQLAFNIYLPSLPNVAKSFSITQSQVQYTVTFYMLAFACAQLFTGTLSDRFGRKPVLLMGLGLFLVASLVCALTNSFFVLVLGRIGQAIGGSTGFVLARAIIRDMHEQHKAASVLGYVTMAMVTVPAIAPFIGGTMEEHFGWRSNFLILVALCLLITLATAQKLPETNLARSTKLNMASMFHNYGQLIRSVPFCGYALTAAFSSAMFWVFAALAPFIIIELLGLRPSEFGLYYLFTPGGFIIGNFLSGRLSMKYGTEKMIAAGNIIALVGCGILAGLAGLGIFTPLAICAPIAIITLSNGLAMTNAIAGAISVNPKIAGAAAGLAGFLQLGLSAGAVFVAGQLQDDTQFPMIGVVLACALMAVAISTLTSRARAEALKGD